MLKFRHQTSFNAHDSQCSVGPDGRIVVTHSVQKRCELVLYALLSKCSSAKEILARLQRRFSNSYTRGDVASALLKLRRIGLIKTKGSKFETQYSVSPNVIKRFRSLPKQLI